MSRFLLKEILIEKELTNYIEKWEILLVEKGKVTVTAGDKIYNLNSGSVAFFAPNEFHFIVKESEDSKYSIFNFLTDNDILNESAIQIPDSFIDLASLSLSEDNQILYSSLELFILLCLKNGEIIEPIKDKNALIFYKATEILIKNVDSQISVEELAKKLKISLSNLKRIFARYTSIGVHEYFNLLKITKAKELLKDGESVTKTAEICGFANQAYFSSSFKRITGLSPKEYSPTKEKTPRTVQKKNSKKKEEKLPSYLL